MFFFEELTRSDCSIQISPQGFFQGIFLTAPMTETTQRWYTVDWRIQISHKTMVGHTQTARDRPFIISIQAAQTGLEAWGSTRKGSLFIWDVKCLVTCWHFPWQQQRLLSPHILSALGTTKKFITVDNTTKGETLRRGDRLNLVWYFCSGCLKLLSKGNNTQENKKSVTDLLFHSFTRLVVNVDIITAGTTGYDINSLFPALPSSRARRTMDNRMPDDEIMVYKNQQRSLLYTKNIITVSQTVRISNLWVCRRLKFQRSHLKYDRNSVFTTSLTRFW